MFRAAVVVAAGGSRRMGSPKALLPWGEVPLLAAHVAALAPWADEVVVVVGADASEVARAASGARVVANPAWRTTHPVDSVRCALAAVPGAGRVLITPVDVPPAPRAVLAALAATEGSVVPAFHGRDGHPVVVDDAARARLTAGELLPEGLRTVLAGAPRVPVPVDVTLDFDTPAEWAARPAP